MAEKFDVHQKIELRDCVVYIGGEDISQYLNEMATTQNFKTADISRSRVIYLPNGYGVWILVDQDGFSAGHAYIVGKVNFQRLRELVELLEEMKRKELLEMGYTEEELKEIYG